MEAHGTPNGSSMVAGPSNQPPTPADLEVARHQGKRTAEVAAATKSLRA
jgi:NAD(P)H dehydrogenase (quinone)